MPIKIITGNPGAIITAQSVKAGPFDATSLKSRIEGPSEAVIQLLASYLGSDVSIEYTKEPSPNATLEVEQVGAILGQPEQPFPYWELFATESQIDITAADIPLINGITPSGMNQVLSYLQGDPNNYPATADSFDAGDGNNQQSCFALLALLAQGVKYYDVAVPTLKRTQVVSGAWPVQAALTNINRVLSTPSLISLEQVPTTLLFNLPYGVTSKTIQIQPPAGGSLPTFGYGWLKKYPQVTQTGLNRWVMNQTWLYQLWSIDVFGPLL